MHKRFLYSVLAVFFCFTLSAQEPQGALPNPCGTAPRIDPWLKAWKAHPEEAALRSPGDTLYAGIQIHLLARNNGTGRFQPERLLDAFCRLNEDFAGSNVRFFFKYDWNLIDNTAWYDHADIPTGIDMMLTNNVPDVLNAYFVADPAGNCGYNLPYGGVAIAHSCADANEHTWAHEIGHALSLQHTFIGWEGTQYNFANPTPELHTYDYTYFHDSLETQVPAPLDTALVERLDGSNCGIAADLFCDTKPDYLSYRWDCDAQGESLVTMKDQTGATFKADGTLFMSYSSDVCSNRFSDEQIAALRANLLTEKAAWLNPGPPEPDVTDLPTLLSPAGGVTTGNTNIDLHWTAVPGATHYFVQVSRLSSYFIRDAVAVVTDTSFTVPSLAPGLTYYWRVRPFNYWYTCTGTTGSASFVAEQSSSVSSGPGAEAWRCYPSLLSPGQALTLELPETWIGHPAQCRLYDAAGRLVWQTGLTPANGKVFLQWPSENWSAGLYRLVWTNEFTTGTTNLVLGGF